MCNRRAALSGLMLSLAINAGADVISIDPALFADGTNISNAFEGVTLTTASIRNLPQIDDWDPAAPPAYTESPVYSHLCSPCAPSTEGQTVFSSDFDDDISPGFSSIEVLRSLINQEPVGMYRNGDALLATFDEGTNFVQIQGGGNRSNNFFIADLWDTAGDYIGRCISDAPNSICNAEIVGDPEIDAFTRNQWLFTYHDENRQIGFLTTGGWAGMQYVRSIAYAAPAPATLFPLAIGLLAIGLIRARGQQLT